MEGVSFGLAALNVTMLFQLVNTAILLLIVGGLVYGLVVMIKAAKRVIKVSDIYLAEHEKEKNTDKGIV